MYGGWYWIMKLVRVFFNEFGLWRVVVNREIEVLFGFFKYFFDFKFLCLLIKIIFIFFMVGYV